MGIFYGSSFRTLFIVSTWDGEDSSAKFRAVKKENSDRLQDEWDEEYDKGRVKKYKPKNDIALSRKNEFQSLQDVRNSSKVGGINKIVNRSPPQNFFFFFFIITCKKLSVYFFNTFFF